MNVAVIFGLLSFAKTAPKFISELIGLPDIGSGDLKDMFNPGKITGLAGGMANLVRNPVSNIRDAWKNNADMVDNRGGKIRRAIQNARRGVNAARHGLGGAARGMTDAALGIVAGDNWAKMNERHKKAIATSKRRSAEGFMKRTDNDARQEYKDKRKAIEQDFKEQGIDINKSMRKIRSDATTAVRNKLDGYNSQISNLQHQIAEGKLNGASYDQLKQWNNELQVAIANRDRLSTKAGFDAEVEKEVQNSKSSLVQKVMQGKTNAIRQKLNDNNQSMANIMTKLSDPTISASERATAEARYAQLLNESEQLRSQLTPEGLASMRDGFAKNLDEQIEIKTERLDKERNISSWTIAKGKADQFFGGEGFTGKGYIDTADLIKNNRSSLYTGEAMTKMRQNADILVDASGNEAEFAVKFSSKPDLKLSYSAMADLKKKADNGSIKQDELEKYGFANIAMVQSAFEDLEKQAAKAYVAANMVTVDPTIQSEFRLRNPEKQANTTIIEGIKRMKAALASSDIPKEEKNELLNQLSTDPGTFFSRGSDIQEKMRTKGSRISAYNSGKRDNQ